MYTFSEGDDRLVMRHEVYGFLGEMGEKMKVEGYTQREACSVIRNLKFG